MPVKDDELGAVRAAEDGGLLERVFGEKVGDQVQVPDPVGEVFLRVGRDGGADPGVGEFAGEDVGVGGEALGGVAGRAWCPWARWESAAQSGGHRGRWGR
ncbi:hypothetical protein OKW18_000825 [Streptomyces pratensis]|nr:hypothetical protein [Streptomyces pratensis]